MTFPPLPWKSANRELWLQVLSIFLPGFIVVTEVALGVSRDLVATLLGANLNFLGATLLFVLVLATSYALGMLCRTVGFGLEERWERRAAGRDPLTPGSSVALEYVQQQYTRDGIVAALEGTPVFDPPQPGHEVTPQHVHDGNFAFAKYWLRVHAPSMSVDRHEIDVNVRLALVLPVALAALAIVPNRDLLFGPGAADRPLAVAIGVTLPTLALAAFVLWSGMRSRRDEKIDALQRYVAAYHVLR
ncbi:MAG TPA: hypothetical protein VE781_08005, partial [Kineosporiaceae bacterium]|nr:hypothetical protein [Kineosporiaceae bacterium]